jgi:hypothetical protein
MLGKIYDRNRNRKKALEFYKQFLSLQKDAELDKADVEYAEKRITRLKWQVRR